MVRATSARRTDASRVVSAARITCREVGARNRSARVPASRRIGMPQRRPAAEPAAMLRLVNVPNFPPNFQISAAAWVQGRGGLTLSCRRPCAVSASAERNHDDWPTPSRAALFAASARVRASKGRLWCLEARLPARFWPGQQPPFFHPSRGNTACICGPSRNSRARCAPVVYGSQRSLKRVYRTAAIVPRLISNAPFVPSRYFCSARHRAIARSNSARDASAPGRVASEGFAATHFRC